MSDTIQEALDKFTARALLMPFNDTRQYIMSSEYLSKSNRQRIKLVDKFARQYKVDKIQAIKRINEVIAMMQHIDGGESSE